MNKFLIKNSLKSVPGFCLPGFLFFSYFFVFNLGICQAQNQSDSLVDSHLDFHEALNFELAKDQNQSGTDTLFKNYIPLIDLETIQDRASCLDLDVPIVINKTVCGFISFFAVRKRNYTQTMLERKNYYFPIFEYYLNKHSMPDALKYLSIVESGMNFKAKSKAGAVGLWQFMPGTGKDFYLAQNQHIDERQNPYLATEAACKFLKQLYGMFNDWELALAAYNCGPGNVLKAMRKSGKRGFWEIYNFLPQETRSYVPQFHAVVYTMNFSAEHNIFADLDSVLTTTTLDTFQISKPFDLAKMESILGLPKNELHRHNPIFRSNVFHPVASNLFLVPTSCSVLFAGNQEKFLDSARVSIREREISKPLQKNYFQVSVKKGESVKEISSRYSVSYSKVCALNKLKNGKILKTGKLKIPGKEPLHQEMIAQETGKMKAGEKDAEPALSKPADQKQYHRVQRGEKLASIARNYGLSVSDLMVWNKMKGKSLKNGQILALSPQNSICEVDTFNHTQPEKLASGLPQFHKICKGDRLFSISKKYGITISQLQQLNPKLSPSLVVGNVIRVSIPETSDLVSTDSSIKPQEVVAHHQGNKTSNATSKVELKKMYLVQKGDTLYSITRKFTKLTIKDLMRINKLKDKNIKPGQQLIVG
jgi:membrane-bound lytic murein transglycosylase D